MRYPKITREIIGVTKKFEFSAPCQLGNSGIGRIYTELTINYITKEYHFLDSGRMFLQNSAGQSIIMKFKKGDELDTAFEKMFSTARAFAEREINKKPKQDHASMMKSAKNLEKALRLGFYHIPLDSRFVGPQGKIILIRNSVPVNSLFDIAEILVIKNKPDDKMILFKARWKRGDSRYHVVNDHNQEIGEWSDKW